mgnify:CR=1 FL=1
MDQLLTIAGWSLCGLWCLGFLLPLSAHWWRRFPRLVRRNAPLDTFPTLTVVVTAKDEGGRISDCLASLLRLCFERSEVVALLATLTDEPELQALQIGVQYSRLVQLAREDSAAGAALDDALRSRLSTSKGPERSCPMIDLATAWTKVRETNDGLATAALLWRVARSQAACVRKLEAVMVEHIHYLAARSFVQQSAA